MPPLKRKNNRQNDAVKKFSVFKLFKRSTAALLLIFLGGFLFNLDRMGDFGIMLLKYKSILPSPIPKFLPGGTAVFSTEVPKEDITGQVIEVYDGDTMTLLTKDNRKYKVRFFGIDAPESAQRFGTRSRDALREKILGKEVVVKVESVDRYQRIVGTVMFDGRHINLEMVRGGFAWYYSAYAPRRYDFADAQQKARLSLTGLWADESPEPPWEWRKNKK